MVCLATAYERFAKIGCACNETVRALGYGDMSAKKPKCWKSWISLLLARAAVATCEQ